MCLLYSCLIDSRSSNEHKSLHRSFIYICVCAQERLYYSREAGVTANAGRQTKTHITYRIETERCKACCNGNNKTNNYKCTKNRKNQQQRQQNTKRKRKWWAKKSARQRANAQQRRAMRIKRVRQQERMRKKNRNNSNKKNTFFSCKSIAFSVSFYFSFLLFGW